MTEPDEASTDLPSDADLEREIRELLGRAGVVPNVAELEPGWAERGEAALQRTLNSAGVVDLAHRRRSIRPRTLRRGAFAVGAVAAVSAVIAGVALIVPHHAIAPAAAADTPPMLTYPSVKAGQLPTSGQNPDGQLGELSDKANGIRTQGSGAIAYVELAQWWTSVDEVARQQKKATTIRAVHTDSYLFSNDRLRLIDRIGPEIDVQGRVMTGQGTGAITADRKVAAEIEPPVTLPRNPNALARLLSRAAGCADLAARCLLQTISRLESSTVVPGSVQSALWSALKLSPDLTYVGGTADRLNRPAAVFMTRDWDPTQRRLVFADVRTGAWLGAETVVAARSERYHGPVPAVLSFTAVVKSQWVTSAQLPPSGK